MRDGGGDDDGGDYKMGATRTTSMVHSCLDDTQQHICEGKVHDPSNEEELISCYLKGFSMKFERHQEI